MPRAGARRTSTSWTRGTDDHGGDTEDASASTSTHPAAGTVVAGGRCRRPRSTPACSAWCWPCVAIWIAFNVLSQRRLPHGPQPVEPVGPEHVDRDHGHGHGADHRVAQHRPVGRVAARLPRLHDGPGADRRHPRVLRPRRQRSAACRTSRTSGSSRSPSASCSAPLVGTRARASSSPTAGCPPFIVTLGGFLVWRGLIFRIGGKQGQTLAPLHTTFQLLGGGAEGLARRVAELGARASSPAPASCSASALARRRRQRYDLAVRPMWVDVGLGVARLRGRHRRRRPDRQPLRLADHRQADRASPTRWSS